jgi:Resolvase, N terminal domain
MAGLATEASATSGRPNHTAVCRPADQGWPRSAGLLLGEPSDISVQRVSRCAVGRPVSRHRNYAGDMPRKTCAVMVAPRSYRAAIALLDYVRDGDTVVVWKLDRLGRDLMHILETVKALTDRGVTLVSTSDGIDSSTAAGRMMIGV